VEFVGVRRRSRSRASSLDHVDIALAIIFKNVARTSGQGRSQVFPAGVRAPLHFLGANVLPMEIIIVVGALP